MNNNPTLTELHLLNCNIGKIVYGDTAHQKGIRIENYQHALELYKEQQELFRKGVVLKYDEIAF